MVDQLSREGELAIDHDVLVLNLTLYSASGIQSLCPKGKLKVHSSVLSLCRHRTCDPKRKLRILMLPSGRTDSSFIWCGHPEMFVLRRGKHER